MVQPPRYGRVAMALHWLIGLALLAEIAFGFLLDDCAVWHAGARRRDQPAQVAGHHPGAAHRGRLAWRLAHAPPPFPESMPQWKQWVALANHRAMYACMVVQPLSGYIASNFSKYGVNFFGMSWPPWGPELQALYSFFSGLHVAVSWLFAALIEGHIAVALKHGLVDRDGVSSRVWPGRADLRR